jgi:hypothetical protein
MGQLTEHLRGIWPGPGHEDHFVFSVKTSKGVCRDDRDINHYFLRKRPGHWASTGRGSDSMHFDAKR